MITSLLASALLGTSHPTHAISQEEPPAARVHGPGSVTIAAAARQDGALPLLEEIQGRVASGLSTEEARRLVARARSVAGAEAGERPLALTAILLACELSESGLADEWERAALELVPMEGELVRLLARFGFLPAPLIDPAERLVAGVEADAPEPDVQAACDVARMDLLLARLRSGARWDDTELADARAWIEEVAVRHAERSHPFGLGLGSYCERALHEVDHLRPGMRAPELRGPDLAGVEQDSSRFEGQVVLLVFWASWCPPCVASLPEENELHKEFGPRGLALVGVNGDPDRDAARAFAEAHGVSWPSFWNGPEGGAGPIAEAWNVLSWPTAYLLDHEGRIRRVFPAGLRGRARAAIEALLAEREAAR